jgi:sugar lactone lactonase YvrE
MLTKHIGTTCISLFCCCMLVFLISCATTPAPPVAKTSPTPVSTVAATKVPTPILTITPTVATSPKSYTSRVLLRNVGRPDDLIFDTQGNLLFSDFYNGTISRLNSDGTATVIQRGINGPEGMVVLSNGTLIVAEQHTNSILSLAPGTSAPTLLRKLPGTPSTASCKDGVDNIAFDATTGTLIIPDSPTGDVYRMSTDGKALTLLASGIVRPVGATVDTQGNIYVADECAGAVWRITPGGKTTRIGGFGMPDDVAFDAYGNMFVVDLAPAIHALIRVNLNSGQHYTVASQGLIEPQGLAIDQQGHIFISDDYADIIMEFIPA